jgi:hypothetical protein
MTALLLKRASGKHGGEAGAHKDRNGIHMAGPGHCQKSCGYAGIEE